MIKASELRIGNFILFKPLGKGDGNVGQMKPGDFSRIACDTIGEYNAILLTPEWLERCGFMQMEYTYYDGSKTDAFVQKGRRYIIRHIELKGVEPYYCMTWFPYLQSQNTIPTELRYLHQLQNLYFVLTDEELTISQQP